MKVSFLGDPELYCDFDSSIQSRKMIELILLFTHLVACDILHLTGEGDVATDPDGVVGHGLEEGRALAAEPATLPERRVGRAAWQQQD